MESDSLVHVLLGAEWLVALTSTSNRVDGRLGEPLGSCDSLLLQLELSHSLLGLDSEVPGVSLPLDGPVVGGQGIELLTVDSLGVDAEAGLLHSGEGVSSEALVVALNGGLAINGASSPASSSPDEVDLPVFGESLLSSIAVELSISNEVALLARAITTLHGTNPSPLDGLDCLGLTEALLFLSTAWVSTHSAGVASGKIL